MSPLMEKALHIKSAHWAYEDEWRVFMNKHGPDAVRFSSPDLTGIILGALASRETLKILHSWGCKTDYPFSNLPSENQRSGV